MANSGEALTGGTATGTARAGATEMESRCIACGGSDHSHRTCVLVGVALYHWLHRTLQLDPGKDMADVVDIILRLLMWGWREARFGEGITCLSYTKWGDVIAAGCGRGIFFMSAQTGEKILCPVREHTDYVRAVSWSPGGEWLASGGDDGVINIWDVEKGEVI